MISTGPRAIIFDFNGVIADDELTHFLAFQRVLAEHGLTLTKQEYYGTYLGMDERSCAAALVTSKMKKDDPLLVQLITDRKASLFQTLTLTQKPPLFPGVVEFVQKLADRYVLAIASGGRRSQIDFALRGTQLEQAFPVLVAAEDAPIGKPDPAIYLTTLDRLNEIAPGPEPRIRCAQCLVLEDSVAGILAARRAGMKVIGLATTYPESELSAADLVFKRITDIEWTKVEELFG